MTIQNTSNSQPCARYQGVTATKKKKVTPIRRCQLTASIRPCPAAGNRAETPVTSSSQDNQKEGSPQLTLSVSVEAWDSNSSPSFPSRTWTRHRRITNGATVIR